MDLFYGFKLWIAMALGLAVRETFLWLRTRHAPWLAFAGVILGSGLVMSTVFSWLSTPGYDLKQRFAVACAGSLAALALLFLQPAPTPETDGDDAPDLDTELQWRVEQAVNDDRESLLAYELRELGTAEAQGEITAEEYSARLRVLLRL